MKAIATRLFAHAYAIYGLSAFALSCLLILPAYFFVFNFTGPAAERNGLRVTRFWGRFVVNLLGIRLRVTGREKIDLDRNYIYVSNHLSQLDIPVTLAANPALFKFLAKQEAARIPVVGYALRKIYFLVDRSSAQSRAASIATLRDAVKGGASVHLYVEGSRNRGPRLLGEFQNGAFQLSAQTGVPLMVLTIVNTYRKLTANRPFRLLPGTVHCHWNGPIVPLGDSPGELSSLKGMVHDIMEGHLRKYYGEEGLR